MIIPVKNYAEIDKKNALIFAQFGTDYKPEENRHNCVLCGKPTSINYSVSHRGHNLVCLDCAHDADKFPNCYADVFEWVDTYTKGANND